MKLQRDETLIRWSILVAGDMTIWIAFAIFTWGSLDRTKIFEKKFIFAWDQMYKEKLTYVKENKIHS